MNIYEQLLAGLKTKFGGVEDAILQRIASKKSEGLTDESKVNSVLEGISFQDVLTSYGDYRADGAQKTAVLNYEKKYHIKDGKAIEEPKPQSNATPAPNLAPNPNESQDLAAQIAAAVGVALKPLNEKVDAWEAQQKAAAWNAKVEAAAKSFGVPEFAYRGRVIAEDTDLNKYMTDLKQEIQNSGYQRSMTPEEGVHERQSEVSSIADQINAGTKEIVEQNNK